MKLSTLLVTLQGKLVDFGDIEVKFARLMEEVSDSKLIEINDVTIEDFEYGKNTVVLWDK